MRIGELLLVYGTLARVDYHGTLHEISLAVDLPSVAEALSEDPADDVPGRVVLVTGDIGAAERAQLRSRQLSFVTSDGVAEFWWPHLRISSAPSASGRPPTSRRQTTVPLRGGHARVVQRLLSRLVEGGGPYGSLGQLAADAVVTPPTVSHVMDKLERHGLVTIEREGRTASPHVVNALALARALRAATAWSTVETYGAYVFGRDLDERLERLGDLLAESSHEVAVTGLLGAAAYGQVRTNISRADVWLRVPAGHEPETWMLDLGLEPAEEVGAPIRVAIDRTGAGVLDARPRDLGPGRLPVAHRARVWADVHDAARGPDIAAQLIDWAEFSSSEELLWTS